MSSWLQGLDAVGLPTFAAELCICFTPFKGRRAGLWTVHCASTNGRCSHHSTMRKNLRKASIQWQKLKRIRLTIYIYIYCWLSLKKVQKSVRTYRVDKNDCLKPFFSSWYLRDWINSDLMGDLCLLKEPTVNNQQSILLHVLRDIRLVNPRGPQIRVLTFCKPSF